MSSERYLTPSVYECCVWISDKKKTLIRVMIDVVQKIRRQNEGAQRRICVRQMPIITSNKSMHGKDSKQ